MARRRTGSRDTLDHAGAPGRLAVFTGFRALIPVFTLVALATSPSLQADTHRVVTLLSAQVGFTIATQALAIRRRSLAALALWVGIIADLIVVTALLTVTGGTGGPLVFLYTIEAMAAGILLSSKLGVRVLGLSTAMIVGLDVAVARGFLGGPSGGLNGLFAIAVLWATGGGAVLFSAFNEREIRRHAAELSTIRQVTLDIEGSLSIGEILTDLCRGVVESFGFTSAAAIIRRDGALVYTAGHEVTGPLNRVVEPRGRLRAAIDAGKTIIVPGDEARADGSLSDVMGARGYLAVPLGSEGILVATRTGRGRRKRTVRAREIEALEGLAHHAALALANGRLHERVTAMAITDPLTGLANHGEFHRALAVESGRIERYRAPGHHLSVLIADLDWFKVLNDTYGHPAGDDVLRRVAGAIRSSVRSFDVAARYGGEEFAVVLPETDSAGAAAVAERIREEVIAATRTAQQPAATVSIGVASAPENGTSAADLIEAADRALYQSKENGRNRVTIAGGKPSRSRVVVPLETATPRARARAARRADAVSPPAPEQSSRPTRRTPRA